VEGVVVRVIAWPRVGDTTFPRATLWFRFDVRSQSLAQPHQIAYPVGRAGDGPAPAA